MMSPQDSITRNAGNTLSRLSDDDHLEFDNESQGIHTIEVKNDGKTVAVVTLNDQGEEVVEKVAHEESLAVLRLRVIVVLVLLCATIIVSGIVYLLTSRSEEVALESVFAGSSEKILVSFERTVTGRLGAITSLGTSYTAFARNDNLTWPFVTMNDFQQRASSTLYLSSALYIQIAPIISDELRADWESYSVENQGWLNSGQAWQKEYFSQTSRRLQVQNSEVNVTTNNSNATSVNESFYSFIADQPDVLPISNKILEVDKNGSSVEVDTTGPGPYFPIWQQSPITPNPAVNLNLATSSIHTPYLQLAATTASINIGGIHTSEPGEFDSPNFYTSFYAFLLSFAERKSVKYNGDPISCIYVPVFDAYEKGKNPVALLIAYISWSTFFEGALPSNSEPLFVVLENSCDGPFTYLVSGESVEFVGKGNLHSTKFTNLEKSSSLQNVSNIQGNEQFGYVLKQDTCVYSVSVYPSDEMAQAYLTRKPIVITFSVVMVFFFTAILFLIYDRLVERRQEMVMKTAERTSAIVSSLFPQQIRARLFAEDKRNNMLGDRQSTKLKSFLAQSVEHKASNLKTKPIADLFTETTVIFADIAGFTAWSSVREPTQVFTLLETLYHSFDEIAKLRRVFKVETVGDCYVAVTGLPDPDPHHAVGMARFAMECMSKMHIVTRELEISLGPDTGDLDMRMGIHSGPVTAGVLRGERSRFQLFGDTMNTAARMESTSVKGRIQLSQETAELLIASGKSNWIELREGTIVAKGKGEMQTYWLNPKKLDGNETSKTYDGSSSETDEADETLRGDDIFTIQTVKLSSDKIMRLIEWNVDVLARLLKQIIARRRSNYVRPSILMEEKISELEAAAAKGLVIDEVREIITLPEFKAKSIMKTDEVDAMELDPTVSRQLHQYVTNIAALYRDNPFHSFEHASHVTMSVTKLLSRIVAPELDLDINSLKTVKTLHDHTYGITSDPLTQFACVFSALIHDVDHSGVPNTQLVKENVKVAQYYKGKSVAEQNSVDLSWQVLMDDSFRELRKAIYSSDVEFRRFRQLVVNSVMATDIVDKQLKDLRNARWAHAFSDEVLAHESARVGVNRKATIVIEHLIQASDVSHTMQHWHIYRKWNERFFNECYQAYKDGRADTDPSLNWYNGEIGFFDFYIIPLAKKLKDCGVFGVSSDEYLNYAEKNRSEWQRRGQEVVAEMLQNANEKLKLG